MSKLASDNGCEIERKLLQTNNPSTLLDDMINKLEIKSCQLSYPIVKTGGKRAGVFKIHYNQHLYLLQVDGSYVFAVHIAQTIVLLKTIKATELEQRIKLMERKIPKDYYFTVNFRKVFGNISIKEEHYA